MLNSHLMRPTALALAVAVALSGCATVDKSFQDHSNTFACGVGAVVGGVLVGGAVALAGGNSTQIVSGGVGGAMLGCGAGFLYKKRVDRLKEIAEKEGLDLAVNEIAVKAKDGSKSVGVEATLQAKEMFPSGSATLTNEGHRQVALLAAEFARDRAKAESGQPQESGRKVLVVGHTDSTGTAELNQRLSEQRARAVGDILAAAGIKRSDIFYQGSGASRPMADNTTEQGRAKNRRVEFVEVDNELVLAQRVRDERANPKYLVHGTSTSPKAGKAEKPPASVKPSAPEKPAVSKPAPKPEIKAEEQVAAKTSGSVPLAGKGGIDFGGTPVVDTYSTLASSIAPATATFALISPAHASAPVTSCVGDMPRIDGEVKNLDSEKSLMSYDTVDFLPGLNGKPWAAAVNGHVAAIGPVAILRDNAQVATPPTLQFKRNYKTKPSDTPSYKGIANTYEGESQILYRVFAVDQMSSPVSCMDIVFDKRSGTAVGGELYYAQQGDAYVAQFDPKRR